MSLPTAMLRGHHEELEGEIEEHFHRVADLDAVEGNEELLEEFVHFLEHEVLTHADAEVKHLYSRVNELKGDDSFTDTMEVDHEYIERYVHEFEHAVEEGDLGDVKRAAARIDGILTPHFDKENEVFLPVLDEHMTREEVEEEVVGPMHGGHHDHDHHGHGHDHGDEGHEGHDHGGHGEGENEGHDHGDHGHEGHDH